MNKLVIKDLSKTYPNGVKALIDINIENENDNNVVDAVIAGRHHA